MSNSKSGKRKKESKPSLSSSAMDIPQTMSSEPPEHSPLLDFLHESPLPWEFIFAGLIIIVLSIIQESIMKYNIHLYFFVAAAVIFFFSYIFKSNRRLLFQSISPVFLIVFAQALLYLAGLFYAFYPKFALQQFFMSFGALLIFASMYVFFLRNDKNYKRFLAVFACSIALISLFSIELATSRLTLAFFKALAAQFGATLPPDYAIFETNTRITTVIGNPNVFAPLAALAMLSALNYSGKAGSRKRSDAVFMALALICGTAFILCFSMGTIFAFIPALIVIIWATDKENRSSILFTNIYCLVASLIAASVVFMLRGNSVIPILSVLILSAAFAILYIYLKPMTLPAFKVKNQKTKIIAVAAIILVLIILALTLTTSYSLSKGATFRRAISLKPGTYSLTVAAEGEKVSSDLYVEIDSMSFAEASLKEKTVLKTDVVNKVIEFTVPSSSAAVFFNFTASSDIRVQKAVISGSGDTKQLSLRYLLVPEFIANRMQGIWVNDNAIQRFVFFLDGIRLGLKSPLIGLGGGAFEGGLYGVADYKYQTNHVHNEYIQNFVDGGLIGFLLFIALTFFIFRALLKAKKAKNIPLLLPLLFGSMVFIFLHSMIEVDFSKPSYRLSALALFALTA
jgi:hypothetical protein